MKHFKQYSSSNTNLIVVILIFLAIIVLIFSIYLFTDATVKLNQLEHRVDDISALQEDFMDVSNLWLIVDYDALPDFTDYILRVYQNGILEVVDSVNWTIRYKEGYKDEQIQHFLQSQLNK
ncbi:MAG: hypothetical protein WCR68_02135 [Candidatus Dojkabacteria bacterium]|jgi:hypothetical protein|nr:hypothetical protein [Candidatus Dojkabacteria bacterium]